MPTDPRPEIEALRSALDWAEHGDMAAVEYDLRQIGFVRLAILARPAPPSEGLREERIQEPGTSGEFGRAVWPEPADWAANGLAALDHLEQLFWSGSGLTAASWDAATDVIRAALTPAEPSAAKETDDAD